MHSWLTDAGARLAAATNTDVTELELDDATIAALLDLARIAAHESGERTNAPLLCYLVGILHGRGHALDGLLEVIDSPSGEA